MTESRLTFHVVGEGPVGQTIQLALEAVQHIPHDSLDADLVVLAIPGEEIASTVEGYAKAGLWSAGQLVAHTSPDFGYSVLEPATKAGAIPLAIHPAMRFTGTSIDLPRLRDARIAVSAPKIALPIAQALAIEIGGEPVIIPEEARSAYAESFSVASEFSAMVVSQAIGLLEAAGIENARDIIGPVVKSSVDRALANGHVGLDPDDVETFE
ncbi:MAG: hypothetical protein RLZZ380_389 [Actinomycetota bacterium]|jgi:predicted short-subunit dehydrogenase-like oxidoreductase (DUF2520 family)